MTSATGPNPHDDWGSPDTPWHAAPPAAQPVSPAQPVLRQPVRQPAAPAPVSPATSRSGTQVWSVWAFVCAAVAVLFIPILFGPAGIAFGVVGSRKGERLGRAAAITAAVATVLGILLALALYV